MRKILALLFGPAALAALAALFALPLTASATTCGVGTDIGNGQCRVYLTASGSGTVPSDWNSANNTIEVIGAGSSGTNGGGGTGGSSDGASGGAGGGGGAYSKTTNVTLTPGASVAFSVGTTGVNGGDTYFCNSVSGCGSVSGTSVITGAKGASGSTGGSASYGVGSVKYSGGNGQSGSAGDTGVPGLWGGAGGAGGAGGGAAGPHGSGASDGTGDAGNTAAGANGTEYDASHGSGGGGVGGAGAGSRYIDESSSCESQNGWPGSPSLTGGTYGAGGGGGGGGGGSPTSYCGEPLGSEGPGGAGGAGTQGLIVITYTPASGGGTCSNPAPVTKADGTKVIYLTCGTQWTVPSDWNNASNTVEAIGAGGAGGGASGYSGAGGGGGAYAKILNVSLTPNVTVNYSIGTGGSTVYGQNHDGGDSYFCTNTSGCMNIADSAVILGARGGLHGGGGGCNNGGAGGRATGSIGTTRYSGGTGGMWNGDLSAPLSCNGGTYTGAGGGGAAGPYGAGSNGQTPTSVGIGSAGGAGDAGYGGAPGSDGNGQYGSSGAEWNTSHGAGGGGSGGGNGGCGGNGGSYGAGGGGSSENSCEGVGNGTQGLIVITYTPGGPATCSVSVSPNPAPYSPSGTATLTWTSQNADTWTYINNVGYLTGSGGSFQVPTTQATDYSCQAMGSGGSDGTHPYTLLVGPYASLTQSATTTTVGQPLTISLNSLNATSCITQKQAPNGTIVNPWATVTSGSATINPDASQVGVIHWWVDCTGPGGTVHSDIYHTLTAIPAPTLTASPTSGTAPFQTTFTLVNGSQTDTITFGDGQSASQWTYDAGAGDYFLNHTYQSPGSYTATVTSAGGQASASVTANCAQRTYCTNASGQEGVGADYNIITSVNTQCVVTYYPPACQQPSFCSAPSSSCLYPPPTFNTGGHLQALPTLIPKGLPVKLSWNITDVSSCSVTSAPSAGSWSGSQAGCDGVTCASPSGGQTTLAVNQQTIFSLSCTGLDPAHTQVNESVTVNIAPVFQER